MRSYFGQAPQSTVTVTIRGNQVKLTGAAHEVAAASTVASLINTAMGAVEQKKYAEAQAVIRNAKGMLPASGSLRSQLEPAIAPLETMINIALSADSGPDLDYSVPSTPTGKFESIPIIPIAGGVVALIVIILLMRR